MKPKRSKQRTIVSRAVAGSAFVCLSTWGSPSLAAEPATPSPATALSSSEPRVPQSPDPSGHRLLWDYPRFRLWQYLASGLVTLTGLYLDLGISSEFPNNGWYGGILFDNGLRSALRPDSEKGRARAARISDSMWHITQYYPVIDGLLVPLVTDRLNFDVALQMTLLNWQAQGLTFTLLRIAHRTVGRARPPLQHCRDDSEYDPICDPDYRGESGSFFSGHSAMTGAGAGLVCAHHQALPLYGGTLFDPAICVVAVTSSLVTGSLRTVADRHWSSDVVFGWLLGGAIGYGVPYLLHYRVRSNQGGLGFLPKNSALIPYATDSGAGITWLGAL